MIFLEWDEDKRASNLRKHGLDFNGLLELFENETATQIDDRFEYGEDRLLTFGLLNGEVLAVVHTEEEKGDDLVVRVISCRKAERYEQEQYFTKVRD